MQWMWGGDRGGKMMGDWEEEREKSDLYLKKKNFLNKIKFKKESSHFNFLK